MARYRLIPVDKPYGYMTDGGYMGAVKMMIFGPGEVEYLYQFFVSEAEYLEYLEEN